MSVRVCLRLHGVRVSISLLVCLCWCLHMCACVHVYMAVYLCRWVRAYITVHGQGDLFVNDIPVFFS